MIALRSPSARLVEHRVQERMRRTIAASMQRRLAAEFNRVARDVSMALGSFEPAITSHEARLEVIFRSSIGRIFVDFGGRALSRIKPLTHGKSLQDHEQEIKASIDAEYGDAVRAYSRQWTARKVAGISNTTRNKVERVIRIAAIDGLDERATAKLMRERIGGGMGASRARTIARTETHSASQDAAFEVVQASGIDVTKEWVSVEDDRTREDHAEANGQEVAMHERFEIGDDELLYPGDPSGSPEEIINCRCVCVYNPARG